MHEIAAALFLLCDFQTPQPSPTPTVPPAVPPFHWFHDVVASAGFQWVSMAVGVFGAAFAIYTWLASKKKERVLEHLFKLAEKSLDKEDAEKELAERRQEVKEASSRIEALQKKIEREIPLEAKRTVLKDRLNMNIAALHRELESVRTLKRDLDALGQTADIPPDLMKSIENEISPEYVKAARREPLKTALTIVMTASAVLGSVVPFYEIKRLIQAPLLLLGGTILLLLIKVSLPSRGTRSYRTIFKYVRYGIGIVGCAASGFFGLIAYALWIERHRGDALAFGGVAMGILLGTVSIVIVMWRKQRAASPEPTSPSIPNKAKHEEAIAAKRLGS